MEVGMNRDSTRRRQLDLFERLDHQKTDFSQAVTGTKAAQYDSDVGSKVANVLDLCKPEQATCPCLGCAGCAGAVAEDADEIVEALHGPRAT
jgi:Na+-translocating ferredoxin:NAD+ oxidoreductase RNF subunit RnfB